MKSYRKLIFGCLIGVSSLSVADTMQTSNISLPSDADMQAQGRQAIGDTARIFERANKVLRVTPQVQIDTSPNNPAFNTPNLRNDLTRDFMVNKPPSALVSKKSKFELIIFVSFSMPDDLLRQYSAQAVESGATLVLRGLYDGSIAKTQARAIPVNPANARLDVAPALFKKFRIETVPAIVLTDTANGSVLENGCARESDYLKVEGDISIRQALLTMRIYGKGSLSTVAGNALKMIENHP